MQELVTKMETAVKTGKRSMQVLLAHDTTLTGILSNLGSKDISWPGYAAHVVVELYATRAKSTFNDNYGVRVLWNGQGLTTDWWDFATKPLATWRDFASKAKARAPPHNMKEVCTR
jgi:hypothetical protein